MPFLRGMSPACCGSTSCTVTYCPGPALYRRSRCWPNDCFLKVGVAGPGVPTGVKGRGTLLKLTSYNHNFFRTIMTDRKCVSGCSLTLSGHGLTLSGRDHTCCGCGLTLSGCGLTWCPCRVAVYASYLHWVETLIVWQQTMGGGLAGCIARSTWEEEEGRQHNYKDIIIILAEINTGSLYSVHNI